MRYVSSILIALFLCQPLAIRAAEPEASIRKVLTAQLEAWNKGDVDQFVLTYSEDCTFVGTSVLQGRSALLARYQKRYPSKAAMGSLSFEDLTVRNLDGQAAAVYGKWHLDRAQQAGGAVGGVFSLVLQLRNGSWLIVLDHTT